MIIMFVQRILWWVKAYSYQNELNDIQQQIGLHIFLFTFCQHFISFQWIIRLKCRCIAGWSRSALTGIRELKTQFLLVQCMEYPRLLCNFFFALLTGVSESGHQVRWTFSVSFFQIMCLLKPEHSQTFSAIPRCLPHFSSHILSSIKLTGALFHNKFLSNFFVEECTRLSIIYRNMWTLLKRHGLNSFDKNF